MGSDLVFKKERGGHNIHGWVTTTCDVPVLYSNFGRLHLEQPPIQRYKHFVSHILLHILHAQKPLSVVLQLVYYCCDGHLGKEHFINKKCGIVVALQTEENPYLIHT